MRVLLLLVLVSVTTKLSVGEHFDYDDESQELFLYQQKLIVLHKILYSKCPTYVSTASRREVNTDLLHLAVARQLYNKMIKELVKCEIELEKASSSKVTATGPQKDCQAFYENGYRESGVYRISVPGLPPFNAWCDFVSGKGWTVIQRKNNNGTVSFNRLWAAYKQGFGDMGGELWLGNEKIHALTATNRKLNIQMVTKDGSQKSGYWSTFYVSDEANNYNLTVEEQTGDLGNSFTSVHSGMAFSTSDRDNDKKKNFNCAAGYEGGWWYNDCSFVNLNRGDDTGMYWSGQLSPLRSSVMRVSR